MIRCPSFVRAWLGVAMAVSVMAAAPRAQDLPTVDSFHSAIDELLDVHVRDGLVYYRALQADRGRLDRYAASLDVPPVRLARWSRDEQAAFWLNAYNALVLRTVVNAYPIRGRAAEYPAGSIRQIPGAFERTTHRVAGEALTLDAIEQTKIAAFGDPRMFFALGRGALGGGRLRSEAFTAARLEEQLAAVRAECVARAVCSRIDASTDGLFASPVFGWREAEFVAAHPGGSEGPYAGRTPLERAVVAFIEPHVYPREREYLALNTFQLRFQPFDWRLNDLTGGRRD
jgi:hypothetical protein